MCFCLFCLYFWYLSKNHLKIILLFGLFISSTERKRIVHSYGFKFTLKTCPRWLLFPADVMPIYGLFCCMYVTEGRLAGTPAHATGQEVRALSCLTFEWMKRVWMRENLATRGFPRAQKPSQNSFSEKQTRDKKYEHGHFPGTLQKMEPSQAQK